MPTSDSHSSGFNRFEDIDAWKEARLLTREIYRITRNRPFASDFALRDQIRRSAISTMSNIAEGFARKRPAEFIQFLSYAKASCSEVQSQLYVAFDAGYISEQTCTALRLAADHVAAMIYGLSRHIQKGLT